MPRARDESLENDTAPLGFGDPSPVKRDAPPLRIDKYDGHPDFDDPLPEEADEPSAPDGPPLRKKKKRKPKPDLLEKLDAIPEPSWARVPLFMLAGGLLLCLIPLIVLVARASEAGAAAGVMAGAIGGVLLFLAVLFQVALMAGVMFGVGILFGIDYGPVGRAVVKLAAIIAMVDGVSGGLGLAFYAGCGGLGILMAVCVSAVLTFALIQTQFELTGFETIVTVMGIELASWSLSAVAFYVLLAKAAKRAAAAGA